MICPVCQWSFTSESPLRIYCSPDCCQRAYQRRKRGLPVHNPKPRQCADCDNVFTPMYHHTRYCSDNCRARVRMRKRGGFNKREVKRVETQAI